MTLDKQRLREKVEEILGYYEELQEDLPSEDKFLEDRLTRRGIEKTVELIADAIIDVALMIISGMGYDKPEDSRGAITLLQQKGILSKAVAAQVQDFVSFRNLLVHRYAKIKGQQEYQSIQEEHEDIPHFVKEIEKFLQRK